MSKGISLDHVQFLQSLCIEDLGQQWDYWSKKYDILMQTADNRVATWPFMSSPFWTCLIVVSYLVMCYNSTRLTCNLGLRKILIGYNVFCISLNGYIVHQLWEAVTTYNWLCQPVDYDPKSKHLVDVILSFFIY